MVKNDKKPRLRFKGFTDEWEQRKLGEIAIEIVAGGDIDKDLILDEGRYPVVANALTNDGIVGYYNSYYRIKVPAVTITARGDVGHAKARCINFTPVVRLLTIKTSHDVFFLENAINTLKIVIESTGVPQLTVPQLAKYQLFFPQQIVEEKQIGLFYKHLDNLITLHQRKYDKLLNEKKALLDKMFPKNQEKTPKIRFKGFFDAWEQRKLGEIGDFKSNGVDKLSKPNEINVNLLNYMDVYNRRKITNKSASLLMQVTARPNQIKENNVLKGDVFFTPTSETADDIGHVMVIEENIKNTVYSYHLMRYRPHKNNFYLTFPNYCLDTYFVRKQMELSAQGVQRFVINRKQFEDLEIRLPSIEEQRKIAVTLTKIDNLITLHQSKCEKLKNIKKALLDKMFV